MQRGRKSPNALNITSVSPRLIAPSSTNAAERAEFDRIVAASAPSHFRPGDIPLIVSLAQANLMTHKLARDPKKIVQWERAARVQAMLSTKLRITPQARTDPKTIGRAALGPPSYYERMRMMENGEDNLEN
jgi:hypothetical protein